jgi:UDP-glucose/iron transport system ATP-binding protein
VTPLLGALGLGRRVGGAWLWRDVSFELDPGDVGVLRGPSGAGKSLMFRALIGLDAPDEGAVQFRGEPASDIPQPRLRAQVLYCAQRALVVSGTVRENLDVPMRFVVHGAGSGGGAAPRSGSAMATRATGAERLFSRLGKAPGFLDRAHDVLSGGEAQLVALVRALLLNPTVLLLDEPTAGLDEATALIVEELVREWVGAGDRAVLWTSHDARQTDRVRRGPDILVGGRS